jgi:antitoxin HicB
MRQGASGPAMRLDAASHFLDSGDHFPDGLRIGLHRAAVTCPALLGLVTEGDTLEEARAMAADAIRCYLESLRKDGLPLPLGEVHDAEAIRESVTVSLERE